jgi:polyhydroxyalkanoate synthesis regulator phasin
MRKRLFTAGAIAVGAGTLLAGPLVAAAQDDDGSWLSDVLSGLVEDGTLTQEQADAVEDAVTDARADRPLREHVSERHGPDHDRHVANHGRGAGPGGGAWERGGPFGGPILDEVADAIGIEPDELSDALLDGQTIAEVATANGVEPQAVIDALVAAAEARLDELVADGRLDEQEAATRLARMTERITEAVNEGAPWRHHHVD